MANVTQSLINTPMGNSGARTLRKNIMALGAAGILAVGAYNVPSGISHAVGFVGHLGDSLAETTHPRNVFNRSEENVINSSTVLPKFTYNICEDNAFVIENGELSTPFKKDSLEESLNNIYLEYSQNVPTNDRICPVSNNWKPEFERLNQDAYNRQLIDKVTFDNVNLDIKSLDKYLERF